MCPPMPKSELDIIKCPNCGKPVNGPTCPSCGLSVHSAETVVCDGCGETTLKEEASTEQYQSPISATWTTNFYCGDCS